MTGKTSEQAKASGAKAKPAKTKPATKQDAAKPDAPLTGPALLSGGNPQIAKGHGDAPVQAYIAAMPGWKSAIGHRLDTLVTQTVPDVQKAVKWNSPLYGMDGQTWFLGIHCFDKYIKLAFFRGTSLTPMPPVASKTEHARYLHIHEDGVFDEAQFIDWMQQASQMPGEKM
ncbi:MULTISPECIES: DUF1801 domain-containing protein [unclassified Rhizobium]|uniref:DUF1801 domain-containing protein n=1 Tax=unclassified Rhizobium TaxID=2613769 RepID=UPI000715B022|nr:MULTISPECIES: DUF1801 domain-containing protein [unclassified Rhizobium]KQS90770.1 histidine kinase [Rhizobium sp. Leaf391]KQS95860.1 histidine kinase [Rhizobium sp. Leaf386]KQU10066.1 histidine kinase [Rhizobium sp. Leaf453]